MMTLAILEHVEKIPYVLSLFLPVAVFFLAGLALAWCLWSKHSRSLKRALAEHERLTADLSCAYQKENDLGNRFSVLLSKQKKHWKGELDQREGQITALTNDLSAELTRFDELDGNFENYKEEAGELRGKVTDLDSKLGGRDEELDSLRKKFAGLEEGTTEKEAEVQGLRDKISELEGTSGGLQKEISGLQSQLTERDSKLGGLESDLAKNVTAMGLLKAQSDSGKGESDGLKSQITELKSSVGEKERELSALKVSFADLEKSSANQPAGADPAELGRLRNDLDSANGNHKETQEKLAKVTRDLEAERNRKPAPAGAQGVFSFSDSGAAKDEKLGFLYRSRPSKVDDLTQISGVGPAIQPKLNNFGVYQFKQVALWSQGNIEAFSEKLDFEGRVEREQWVNQAADLHRKHHGESLAPIVNIYHKPVTTAPAKPAESSSNPFKDQPVRVDPKLGVLFTSRPSEIDDLKLIKGVAGVLEKKLHEIGLYRFKQVAMWTDQQAADFSDKLAFPGRVERDEWVKQATEFHAQKYGES